MKHGKLHSPEWRPYGDAALSLLTFPIVVGLLYWAIRLGCVEGLKVIAGR
jgi:hypothetical protein